MDAKLHQNTRRSTQFSGIDFSHAIQLYEIFPSFSTSRDRIKGILLGTSLPSV